MGCRRAELPLWMPPEMMASAVYLHDLDSGRGLFCFWSWASEPDISGLIGTTTQVAFLAGPDG
jgi:hypothetical protein